jgi:hypothetical protein
MAKAPKGSSSNSTQTKAGKKSGSYTEPPAPSSEKAAASEQGRQQFTAKEFPKPLPAQKGTWEAAMDTLCAHFNVRRIRTRQDDNGMRFDENRKQWVYPPLKEAVGKK